VPEPTQLLVEGMLMKLLAQSPDGTLMCCANETHLKFVDSRFLKLYETNTPGAIMAASFHPQKYELFLKIDNRTLVSHPDRRSVSGRAHVHEPCLSCILAVTTTACTSLNGRYGVLCRFSIWPQKNTESRINQIR